MTCADNLMGKVIRIGWVHQHEWLRVKANREMSEVLHALLHVAACGLHLRGCVGGRVGRGVPVLEGVQEIDDSFLWWWNSTDHDSTWYLSTTAITRLKLADTFGSGWRDVSFVQFFLTDDNEIERLRRLEPHMPNIGGQFDPDVNMPQAWDPPPA